VGEREGERKRGREGGGGWKGIDVDGREEMRGKWRRELRLEENRNEDEGDREMAKVDKGA
jgi:hypothetical protein